MWFRTNNNFQANMEYVNVKLKTNEAEKIVIGGVIDQCHTMYVRYCQEQIRRICNGVPMVYADKWFCNPENRLYTESLSSRVAVRTLTYGFDLIVRNQNSIRMTKNPTMNKALTMLRSLEYSKYEYGIKSRLIVIPKQEGMEGNLFKRHKIHIPKIGKFSVSDKEMKKVPDNIKIKMIRIFTKGSDVYANIAYVRMEERDDEGFITLIKNHYPNKAMEA